MLRSKLYGHLDNDDSTATMESFKDGNDKAADASHLVNSLDRPRSSLLDEKIAASMRSVRQMQSMRQDTTEGIGVAARPARFGSRRSLGEKPTTGRRNSKSSSQPMLNKRFESTREMTTGTDIFKDCKQEQNSATATQKRPGLKGDRTQSSHLAVYRYQTKSASRSSGRPKRKMETSANFTWKREPTSKSDTNDTELSPVQEKSRRRSSQSRQMQKSTCARRLSNSRELLHSPSARRLSQSRDELKVSPSARRLSHPRDAHAVFPRRLSLSRDEFMSPRARRSSQSRDAQAPSQRKLSQSRDELKVPPSARRLSHPRDARALSPKRLSLSRDEFMSPRARRSSQSRDAQVPFQRRLSQSRDDLKVSPSARRLSHPRDPQAPFQRRLSLSRDEFVSPRARRSSQLGDAQAPSQRRLSQSRDEFMSPRARRSSLVLRASLPASPEMETDVVATSANVNKQGIGEIAKLLQRSKRVHAENQQLEEAKRGARLTKIRARRRAKQAPESPDHMVATHRERALPMGLQAIPTI
jgi:hypothetical protein